MATVAATLTLFDTLRDEERRPTEYAERWDQLETDLATLNDGAGSVSGTQASLATLKSERRRPIFSGTDWDAVRAQMAVLADT